MAIPTIPPVPNGIRTTWPTRRAKAKASKTRWRTYRKKLQTVTPDMMLAAERRIPHREGCTNPSISTRPDWEGNVRITCPTCLAMWTIK